MICEFVERLRRGVQLPEPAVDQDQAGQRFLFCQQPR